MEFDFPASAFFYSLKHERVQSSLSPRRIIFSTQPFDHAKLRGWWSLSRLYSRYTMNGVLRMYTFLICRSEMQSSLSFERRSRTEFLAWCLLGRFRAFCRHQAGGRNIIPAWYTTMSFAVSISRAVEGQCIFFPTARFLGRLRILYLLHVKARPSSRGALTEVYLHHHTMHLWVDSVWQLLGYRRRHPILGLEEVCRLHATTSNSYIFW